MRTRSGTLSNDGLDLILRTWMALALAVLLPAFPARSETPETAFDVLRAVHLPGLDARSVALILSGEEGGELDVSVLAIPLRGGPGRVRTVLVVDVEDGEPGGEAEPEDGEPRITEVYAYALDDRQEVGGFLTQGFAVEPAERRGVKFFGHLDLAPGSYSLRVLVMRRHGERLGLRVLPLEVPPRIEDSSPPALDAEPAERWVLVAQAAAEGSDEAAFPLVIDGRPVIPATRQRPAAEGPEVAGAVSGDLSLGDDLSLDDLSLEDESLEDVSLEAVSLEDLEMEAAVLRRRRQIVAAYSEALHVLTAGDREAAGSALTTLERAALSQGADDTLVPSLLSFARRLAKVERHSIVPLIHLHEKLYREHYRRGDYRLATHARLMSIGLAEIYAKRDDSAESRTLLAGVYVSLGSYLQELGSVPAARLAFEQARRYDEVHEAALLGLAAIHEAYGDPAAAADLLKRLLAAHPGNSEALLRRATCLVRMSSPKQAEALLRRSLDSAGPDWVRAVAYQELAGLYVTQKRFQEAAALLADAVEELPRTQRLYVQLAAVYDHMERPAEAREALARLDPGAGRDTDSPRLAYSRWPRRLVEASRRTLDEAAEAHMSTLAAALRPFAARVDQ